MSDGLEPALRELIETWRRQQEAYPVHTEGDAAAAAVRACAEELEEVLDGKSNVDGTTGGGLETWLDDRIEETRESYNRDTNHRHTAISLGKLRAYRHVRVEVSEE